MSTNIDKIVSWRNKNSSKFTPPTQRFNNHITKTHYHQPQHHNHRTSYGVILCREIDNELRYALVRKRLSYGVSYILKGDWKKEYFAEISHTEKDMFKKICLMEEDWESALMYLWSEMEGKYGEALNIESYKICRDRIIQNREWLYNEFQSSTLIFGNGVWEFPKGRFENRRDTSPQHCALRELEEETGIKNTSVKLLDFGSFHEKYNTIWDSIYYVGVLSEEHNMSKNETMLTGECSVMKWCSFEEALELIPSVMHERLSILAQVHSKEKWIKRALKS